MDLDLDPSEILILRPQALASGLTDNELGRLVRQGILRRIRPGAFVAADIWDPMVPPDRHRVLSRAVLAKAQAEVALSHVSAAVEHGAPTWGLDLTDVNLVRLDRRAGRREAGVRQHQGRIIEADIVDVAGTKITSPTKTALDVATSSSLDAGLCVVNDLLHRGLTDLDSLEERYALMEQDPFTLRTGLVLKLAQPLVASVGETRTYVLCWRESLPAPTLQHPVADLDGRVFAFLDFAWPALGKWIEFDGRTKYVDFLQPGESVADVVLREKAREDRIRECTGWQCLRITWADLRDPVRLGARIRAFLGLPAHFAGAARRLA